MKYLSYLTEKCIGDAKRHNFVEELNKIGGKINTDQSIGTFDRFLPSPFIRKKLATYRIVAIEKIVGDFNIICFLRILPRGSQEYSEFINNPNEYLNQAPSDHILQQYIAGINQFELPMPKRLQSCEEEFLNTTNNLWEFDGNIIIETEEWVKRINDNALSNYRVRYHEIILNLLENSDPKSNIANNKNHPDIRILYRFLPELKTILLIAPIKQNIPQDEENLRNRFSDILIKDTLSKEEILRRGRKYYPEYVVYDDSIWLNIQQNADGNLALSPEEEDILKELNSPEISERYPLFINGRPGSGKSTILMYLFSDILYKFYNMGGHRTFENPPLFLTYSEKLLQVAKDTTKKLISCNATKQANSKLNIEESDYKKSFQTFREFLISLIPEGGNLYQKEKYVNYPKFKEIWQRYIPKNPDAFLRNLNPEIAWHVIRTYIKGMSNANGEYFDADSYKNELPKNQMTVTQSTFDIIYEKVWINWYQPLSAKEDYWDDQDLARKVLDLGIEISKYPAIFCDEAQDFTRNELELIINLSLYTKRDVTLSLLKNIPFAFAGDPFQTLNPTGFDWGAVKANFYEKIVKNLDPFGRGNLKFNFRELSFNYRSSNKIVGLSNLIQLLRGVLFNKKNILPQQTWFSTEALSPVFYKANNHEMQKALREQEELVILIPCQEGEETAWVNNDPFLSGFALDDGILIRNILSPMKSKGLEFSRVVLYKFGQQCSYYFKNKLLKCLEDNKLSPEELLPYEYFLNSLYVAASRPKNRLFIVDTEEGLENLWLFAENHADDIFIKYQDVDPHNNWTEEYINGYQPGEVQYWEDERDDPIALAKLFEELGISNKDVDNLRFAKQNYLRGNDASNARKVDAYIFEINDQFEKAAEIFDDLGMEKKALHVLWKANAFGKMVDLATKYSSIRNNSKIMAAEFMQNTDKGSISFLSYLYESLQSSTAEKQLYSELLTDSNWKNVLLTLSEALQKTGEKENNLSTWKIIHAQLCVLKEKGISLKDDAFAIITYFAGEYDSAIKIWESFENIKLPDQYKEAKVLTTAYPQKIKWRYELKQYETIIDEFEKYGYDVINDNSIKKNIFDVLIMQNRIDLIMPFLKDNYSLATGIDKGTILNILNDLFTKKEYKLAISILNSITNENLVDFEKEIKPVNENKEKLLMIIAIMSKNFIRSSEWKKVKNILASYHNQGFDKILNKIIINEIAKSDSEAFRHIQDIANYLKGKFISSDNWTDYADVLVAGTAIEKAYKVIDALEFYESIWKYSQKYSDDDVALAKKRWYVCKKRYADITKKVSDREKILNEAVLKKNEWNLDAFFGKEEYPPFENIDPDIYNTDNLLLEYLEKHAEKSKIMDVIEEKPKFKNTINNKLEVPINDINYLIKTEYFEESKKKFEIEFLSNKKIVRIKNVTTDEQISVLCAKKVITGEVEFSLSENEQCHYYNKDWNLFVKFSQALDQDILVLSGPEKDNMRMIFPLN